MAMLWWLLFLTSWQALVEARLPCSPGCICMDETTLRCTRNGSWIGITANRYQNPYLTIDCEDGKLDYNTDLPDYVIFDKNPTLNVQFQNCPLPPNANPLLNITNRFGQSSISGLTLINCTGDLNKEYFQDLEPTLKTLTFRDMDNTTIPSWVFDILPALQHFVVTHSKIVLKPSDFENATQLRILEIMFCNVTELPSKLFSSLKQLYRLNLVGNEIKRVDQQFQDLELLKYLDLSTNQIRQISVDAFKGSKNLRKISLFENELNDIPTGLFEGLKMLQEVTIHKNKASVEIGAGAFADLPALKRLYLEDSNITNLPHDVFRNSTALTDLSLTRNNITHLPPDIFKDLQNLSTLDLSRNKIKTIVPEHFNYLKSLKTLNLDYNRIETLPRDLFSGLSEVMELTLKNNSLQLIDERAFLGCEQITSLSLANNMLTMKIGVKLDVSPLNRLRSLRHLNLSGNRIPRLYRDWLLTMLDLTSLNLARNNITQLRDEDLEFLQRNNITVDLRNNKIQFIVLASNANPRVFGTILLQNNPIQCDCHLFNFLRLIDTQIFDISDLKCYRPPAFNNTYVKDVNVHKLTCQVHDCPSTCSCTARPANSSLELTCSSQPSGKDIPNLQYRGLSKTVLTINKTITKLHELPELVTELVLSNLSLTQLPTGNYTVKLIDLSHNQISTAEGLFNINNYTSYKLSGNPFVCDCEHKDDVTIIQDNNKRIKDYAELKCGKEFIWRCDKGRLCSTRNALVLGVCITCFALLVVMLTILYYRYQREIKLLMYYYGWWPSSAEEALDRDKQYDAFVSFAHEDTDFVMNILLPVLESEPNNFKLCIHTRDWIPGQLIQDQIYRSVEESRRTILVLSKSFIESTWSLLEFGAALKNASSEKRAKIIAIVLDDVTEDTKIDKNLKAFITTNTYVKWGDPWFWEKLVYALPKRHNVKYESKNKPKGIELGRKLAENALDARVVFGNKAKY